MTAQILLVRHGQTEWSKTGRVQGWAPVPLNERGHEQARNVASRIISQYDIDRIISSDLRRALQTAEKLVEASNDVAFQTDSAWRERDFGIYQGLDDDYFNSMNLDGDGFSEAPESGESWKEVVLRTEEAWNDLVESVEDSVIVVISHFGPISLLLGEIAGNDLQTCLDKSLPTCSIQQITIDSDGSISIKKGSVSKSQS